MPRLIQSRERRHICNSFNPQAANVWLREGAFEVCSIFLKWSEFPACKNWEASL